VVSGDNWSYRSVVQSSSQIIITNKPTPSISQAGCPSCRPTTVSKHWRENITFHGLAYPKLTWGLPTLSFTTNSSWLPWGRFAMPLNSPLMPVPLSDASTPVFSAITWLNQFALTLLVVWREGHVTCRKSLPPAIPGGFSMEDPGDPA